MLLAEAYLDDCLLAGPVPLVGTVRLGRDASNDLVLDEASVSRFHATLEPSQLTSERQVAVVRDLGSTNGSFVNGCPVKERVVTLTDVILFGSCRVVLRRSQPTSEFRDAGKQTIVFRGNPFAESQAGARHQEALHRFATALPTLSGEDLLDAAAKTLSESPGFDTFCVLLKAEKDLYVRRAWNSRGPCDRSDIEISQTLIDLVFRTGEPIISERMGSDHRLRHAKSAVIRKRTTAICAPIIGSDGVFGVVYASSQLRRIQYNRGDLGFLVLIASNLASAICYRDSLRQRELQARKIEEVLSNLRESVILCDDSFRILSANPSALRLLGEESPLGKGLAVALAAGGCRHSFDPTTVGVRNAFEVERTTGGPSVPQPERHEYFDATVSRIHGLEDAEGLSHIVCLRDVTETRVSQSRRALLTNRLAHKLRGPLTVVNSVSTFFGESMVPNGDPELAEMVEAGIRACHELGSIVDRFVRLSGNEVTASDLLLEVIPLSRLFQEAREATVSVVEQAGLTIVDELSASTEWLAVDAGKIVCCFAEFIENAAKFAGEGATLHVFHSVDANGIAISFADDGSGVGTSDLGALFDMFYQVDPEQTGETPGVGLGLWWAREVVQRHGGDIRVAEPEDEATPGVRFEILLPARVLRSPDGRDGRGPSSNAVLEAESARSSGAWDEDPEGDSESAHYDFESS